MAKEMLNDFWDVEASFSETSNDQLVRQLIEEGPRISYIFSYMRINQL